MSQFLVLGDASRYFFIETMQGPLTIVSINSTAQALSYVYSLSLNATTFRFRGQVNAAWTIQPSVYRMENSLRYQAEVYERFVLAEKPKTPTPPLTHTTFDLEWLMLCQHYGIPTRLLDWTADILIALYFATDDENYDSSDGLLLVSDVKDYPIFGAYDTHATGTQELAFVSTSVVNPRMRMQNGSFMLWGRAPLDVGSTESYDLLQYHRAKGIPPSFEQLLVPSHAKGRIREELREIYSITADTVYLKSGFLENTYSSRFAALKRQAKLKTFYVTDSDLLTASEQSEARSMFAIECKDMYKGCVSIGKTT